MSGKEAIDYTEEDARLIAYSGWVQCPWESLPDEAVDIDETVFDMSSTPYNRYFLRGEA